MEPTSPGKPARPVRRALLLGVQALVAGLILLDEVARPLYRPLGRWLSERRIVARMEAAVATLPPYAILALLAVPFAIAEPLKIAGAVLVARGQALSGLAILAVSYLASFLIVERIYHAGQAKLLSIGWFAWIMSRVITLRDRLLAWVRASPPYAFALRTRDAVRRWWRAHNG